MVGANIWNLSGCPFDVSAIQLAGLAGEGLYVHQDTGLVGLEPIAETDLEPIQGAQLAERSIDSPVSAGLAGRNLPRRMVMERLLTVAVGRSLVSRRHSLLVTSTPATPKSTGSPPNNTRLASIP